MPSTHRDIYVTGLVNAHALEKQAVQLLGRQADRLENYPAMLERIRLHIDESERQAERLQQILEALGTSPSTLKDLGLQIMGNVAAMTHAVAQDEVVKNTLANYAFEHMEIATYRSLLTMADVVGDNAHPRLLQQSLDEEIRMAQWIEDNLDQTVRTYMDREVAGVTAGV
jgi:ferritin-like metal-binding protein YciE